MSEIPHERFSVPNVAEVARLQEFGYIPRLREFSGVAEVMSLRGTKQPETSARFFANSATCTTEFLYSPNLRLSYLSDLPTLDS
ncbi:hypothetical protein H8E77_20720 [bacterium]|nr:hypothetical protein [bacterium]